MEKLRDLLRSNNLKATHQRLAILGCVDRFGHIDIDAIYDFILKKYSTMSKATVYRNINELISYNIIEEIKLPHKNKQYEIKKIPHIHLLCKKCSKVEDLFLETKHLLESIKSNSGFKVEHSFIVIDGICKECQKS
ncbi:MAG: transcriptional repressor [Campylobacteraceae bacterium]|nr:transcriptional repressor [Campylobacteraceae bacterium]